MANAKRSNKPAKTKPAPKARPKKALGHEGGKRVAALRKPKGAKATSEPKAEGAFVERFKKRIEAAESGPVMRVTHPSNGTMPTAAVLPAPGITAGEAIRRVMEELGEANIDPETSTASLRRINEAFENVKKEQAVYAVKADAAKVAKKALDAAQDYLLVVVGEETHPVALPLFDKTREEQARQEMEAGPVDLVAGAAAEAQGDAIDGPDGTEGLDTDDTDYSALDNDDQDTDGTSDNRIF